MSINEYYIYGTKKKLFDVNDVNFAVDFKNHLKQIIKNTSKKYNEILVLCIGTDRSTGDSFAPIIGTILSNNKKLPYKVLGTLENPIHAKNLVETLEKINREKTLIIAVDACLGKIENVEKIKVFEGGLKPGSGVGKEHLPVVGDISIVGIVNCYDGVMDFLMLQNTRLGIVYKLAKITSKFLHETLCEISNVSIFDILMNYIMNFIDGLKTKLAINIR